MKTDSSTKSAEPKLDILDQIHLTNLEARLLESAEDFALANDDKPSECLEWECLETIKALRIELEKARARAEGNGNLP